MNKDYVVYGLRLAHFLINRGFELKNTSININNPKYKVFYFENSEELQAAVASYKSNPYQ